DEFLYFRPGDIETGETVVGGAGFDIIGVFNGSTFDFSRATVSGIEELAFSGAGTTAILASSQIGSGGIGTVVFNNPANSSRLVVIGVAVDLTGVAFSGWRANHKITVEGTVGADRLIGSAEADTFDAKGGKDHLSGGSGRDTFRFDTALS